MPKYIFQLRRGVKETDANGNITRDDWGEYEAKENHMKPLEGELVLEYDNGIPRLKIGDGINEFSALPYMSVDSFILAESAEKTVTTTLSADNWVETKDEEGNTIENSWCQTILQGCKYVTPNSKVDLQPSTEQLAIFHEKDLAFVTENEDGVVTAFCVGQKPTNTYIMQATITEVICDA